MAGSGAHVRPLAVLALGVAGVSSAAVLIRLAALPALTVTAWRLAGGAAAFGLVMLLQDRRLPWAGLDRREVGLLLVSAAALAAHFITWILSLEYTSVTSSVVLVATTPIWVALGSRSLLAEPVGAGVWAGIAVAVAGSAAIAVSDAGSEPLFAGRAPLTGDALALVGAWCVSVYYLAGRRLRRKMETVRYVTAVYGGAAVLALAVVAIAGAPVTGFRPAAYGYLVLLILLPQIIGHTSFNWALGHVSATLTTVAVLLEPVGASLLAWWILAEAPGAGQAIGGIVVLLGVLLAAGAEQRGMAATVPTGTGSSGAPSL